jgi:hypothetical protein
MANVRIEYELSEGVLVGAMIYGFDRTPFEGDLADWLAGQTRTSVDALMRRGLETLGYGVVYQTDHVAEDALDAIVTRVRELFPEVAP